MWIRFEIGADEILDLLGRGDKSEEISYSEFFSKKLKSQKSISDEEVEKVAAGRGIKISAAKALMERLFTSAVITGVNDVFLRDEDEPSGK